MSTQPDLQVDTGCIRQAAATLADAGHRWNSAASGPAPATSPGSLGSRPGAAALVRLVALRCEQAGQATDQLAAVAIGMSQQLTLCADTFDRVEAGLRWPR